MNFFQDVKTVASVLTECRKARRDGGRIEVKPVYRIPVVDFGYWTWTAEACLFTGDLNRAVCAVFKTFDEATQHALTFTPPHGSGEWAERARLWQKALRPTLSPEMYRAAMSRIYRWCRNCVLYGQARAPKIITGHCGPSEIVEVKNRQVQTVYISASVPSADTYRVARDLIAKARSQECAKMERMRVR